jgi:hypothetical protein
LTKQAIKYYSLITKFLTVCFLLLVQEQVPAQVRIKGTVYDETGFIPVRSVSVINSSGKGTLSDSAGHYSLLMNENDSLRFSYLGKETQQFAFADIPDANNFTIALKVNVPVLKEVTVRPPDRRIDSIQNRVDYAKVFNYKKPFFGSVVKAISITGIVIDIDELIRVFQYREKRMMIGFQNRLIEEEHQKYILYRFTKPLVSEITGLKEDILDSFMVRYRPAYSFVVAASDYSLRKYIKDSYETHPTEFAKSKPED